MERKAVASSNIKSVGYDKNTKTLEVEFNNGNVYQYGEFPVNVYQDFMEAESVGKFFNQVIKPNYEAVKLPKPEPTEEKVK